MLFLSFFFFFAVEITMRTMSPDCRENVDIVAPSPEEVCAHAREHVYVCVSTCVHVFVCMSVCVHMNTHSCMRACVPVY